MLIFPHGTWKANIRSVILNYSLEKTFLHTYMSSLGCMAFCIDINFLVLWSFWFLPLSIFRMIPSILRRHRSGVYPFDEISAIFFSFYTFSCSSEVQFCYFFFHIRLFDDVCLQCYEVLEVFFFSPSVLIFLLIWQSYSFYLSFSTSHYEHNAFFYSKIHS